MPQIIAVDHRNGWRFQVALGPNRSEMQNYPEGPRPSDARVLNDAARLLANPQPQPAEIAELQAELARLEGAAEAVRAQLRIKADVQSAQSAEDVPL